MTGDGSDTTRRELLRHALAGGAIASLAGCSSLGIGDGTPGNDGTETLEQESGDEMDGEEQAQTPSPTPTPEPVVNLSGSIPGYRYGSRRRAFAPSVTGPTDEPTVAYRRDLPAATTQPVVDREKLYLADSKRLSSFDLPSGTNQWNVRLNNVGGPPSVSLGTAYVLTDAGLVAVERNGSLAWRGTATGTGTFASTSLDNSLYAADDTSLAAYGRDGEDQWGVPLGSRVLATPAAAEGRVYVPASAGPNETNVLALRARDGQTDWRTSIDAKENVPPVFADGTVYVVDEDDGMAALSAEDGEREWTIDASIDSPLAVSRDRVFVADDWSVTTFGIDEGGTDWSTELDGTVTAGPVVDAETVYAGTETAEGGMLHALDRTDGSNRWTVSLEGTPASSPAVVDRGIAVTTGDQDSGQLVVVTG